MHSSRLVLTLDRSHADRHSRDARPAWRNLQEREAGPTWLAESVAGPFPPPLWIAEMTAHKHRSAPGCRKNKKVRSQLIRRSTLRCANAFCSSLKSLDWLHIVTGNPAVLPLVSLYSVPVGRRNDNQNFGSAGQQDESAGGVKRCRPQRRAGSLDPPFDLLPKALPPLFQSLRFAGIWFPRSARRCIGRLQNSSHSCVARVGSYCRRFWRRRRTPTCARGGGSG